MNTNTQDTPQPASATRPDCAPPIGSQLWPCPHRCDTWARCEPIDLKRPMPNHHPRCEHYNASLIDVFRVSHEDGGSYVTDKEPSPNDLGDGLKVSPEQMHREVYENLPEFDGF